MTSRQHKNPWHGLSARGLLLPTLLLAACGDEPDSDGVMINPPPATAAASEITDELVSANNKGVALMGSFDYEAAVTHFESLHADYPDNHDVTVNLAIATLNRQRDGDEARALELLEGVLDAAPAHTRAMYGAGLLNLNAGDSAKAREHFTAVVTARPDDAFAQYYLGLCSSQIGNAAGAEHHFEQAIERNPYLRSAYYGLFQTLQRAGETDRAKEMLDTFQKLAENPKAQLAEFKYTRMGDLAMALAFDNPDAEPVAEADPFRAFGEAIELIPEWRGLERIRGADRVGISSVDFDNDGETDIFFDQGLPETKRTELELMLDGVSVFSIADLLEIRASESPLGMTASSVKSVLWGDINNDGATDAYLCCTGPNMLYIQTDAGWLDATEEFGVSGGELHTLDGRLVDADHDGDLDIFLINANAPNALLNNNRDGTFADIAAQQGIAGSGEGWPHGVVFADLDNDRDLDIIVLNSDPPHEVYENKLLWEYGPMAGFETFKATILESVAIADTDTDGIPELFTVDGSTMSRWFQQGGEWTNVHNRPAPGSEDLLLLDADNDGTLEILHWGGSSITLAQLHPGDDTWTHDGVSVKSVVPAVFDPEKGVELLAMDGFVPVLFPPGPGRQNTLALTLKGAESAADQMRTNFSAFGTTVRARVGSRWSTATNLPNSTSIQGQSLTPLPLGLGPAQRADYIEILWPDGVYQTELGLEAGQLHEITETQRQLSSCPVLFAWNGREYGFVSDILGTGGIGFALAPGEYAPSDPTENFLFPEGTIAPKDGAYELKIGEPMEEVAYLDRVGLLACDLPPGWRMTLDERMHTGGDFVPTGEPIYYRHATSPARVTNDRDDTVTLDVALRDNTAAPLPPLDRRFIGRTTSEHVLTVEFDEPLDARPGEPTLVIDGWVEYPYSQVMFAAWQADASYEPLTLDARDPATGEWVTLLEKFGYPAGMPRQMSAPMPNLPAGATAIRLRTTLEIYVDRLFVASAEPCPDARVTELALTDATLSAPGFPRRINHLQRRPDYDESDRVPLWDTRHPEGTYTALGPCRDLLAEEDGALTILGPGEEVLLRFASPPSAPPSGWVRKLVATSKGWCKDMDLYTEQTNSISPLPAHPIHENARKLMDSHTTRWMRGK